MRGRQAMHANQTLEWTGPAEGSLSFEAWSVPGRPFNVGPLCDMTANGWLIIFLLAFWIGLWLFVKIDHFVHGRPLSDGPSFIPVVPVLPLVAYGAGWLLNWAVPWLGTGIVAVTHVSYLCVAGASAWRASRRSGDVA